MMTIRDKLVTVLEGAGWKRDFAARTRKFWVYRHVEFEKALYLGKAGALRFGMTVAHATPRDGFKAKLLGKFERDLKTT